MTEVATSSLSTVFPALPNCMTVQNYITVVLKKKKTVDDAKKYVRMSFVEMCMKRR